QGQVAGKTGTAELGQVVEAEEGAEEEVVEGEEESIPEHRKDAWFSAFATVEKPKLAIGVLLIEAEAAGGEVAAPVASEVLSAGYEKRRAARGRGLRSPRPFPGPGG